MKSRYGFVMLLAVALPLALAVQLQCAPAGVGPDVAARVGGRVITLAQVDQRWNALDRASQLQALQQMYEGRARTLDLMIGEHLIDLEARARGMSREQLLQVETSKRTQAVTDDDVARAYQEAGDQARGTTLDDVRPAITQYLEQQRYSAALQAFAGELRRKSDQVQVALDAPRLQVTSSPSDPAHGTTDAPVEIIEFSDFQCPFCKQVGPTLKKIQATFGDRIRLVYRDVPLPHHGEAFLAAEAAQCAHDQGQFWAYHDMLFANQQALQGPRLREYAIHLGLDAARFSKCLEQGQFKHLVEQDLMDAQRHGISSTPTFFINGRVLAGAVPYEEFEQIIRDELARRESGTN